MKATGRPMIASSYDRVVRNALGAQLIVGCLALLTLDGGILAQVVGTTILAFWLCAGGLIARRPMAPTTLDLMFIEFGFWVVLGVATLRQVAT